ncbi:MAG TPA: acetaldehyde dehydrogenase, partial [Bacillota bacterium]|nr:acetaldehyde dehydrogenase [Bacillota bacterium]
GHTFCIHTEDRKILDYFVSRIPASRIIVNAGGTFGGIGATTHLMPSMTLGCGAEGGSATSDNVGPLNLINKRIVAYGLQEIEDVKKEALECRPICSVENNSHKPAVDPALEDIILAVFRKMQELGTL